MDKTEAFVAIVHSNKNGTEAVTRVRAEVADAYADSLRAEAFVLADTVRVLTILPASKHRLAEVTT